MKKSLSLLTLVAMFAFAQGAFAWTYDGLGSLNPFTNFGRGFGGNTSCGCERIQNRTTYNIHPTTRKHLTYGYPTGYAAPVNKNTCGCKQMPIVYQDNCPCETPIRKNPCNNCTRK